jgi:Timeless protein
LEDDRLIIERILILIRNILDIPPNPDDEKRTDDDASIHDQVITSCVLPHDDTLVSFFLLFVNGNIFLIPEGSLVHAPLWNGRCDNLLGL